MGIATVNSVTHNVQKTSAQGKSYTVSTLSYTTEKGQTKKQDIFTSAPYFKVVSGLAQGDIIDVKMVQNGQFWNISDIKKTGSSGGASQSTIPSVTPSRPPFVEDKEKQASIQRQNALTNATNLVSSMLAQEMFKKTTKPNILIDEIIKIASAFEDYTSGRTKLTATESVKPSVDSADTSEVFDGTFEE